MVSLAPAAPTPIWSKMTLMREAAFDPELHPSFLTIESPVGSVRLSPWENESLAKVVKGDPTKGWEGDPRLAWYWDGQRQCGVLVRRESDGAYRAVLSTQPYQIDLPAAANRIIDQLIIQDVRRGFDVKKAVDAHNDKVTAENEHHASELRGPAIEKLGWGLARDLRVGPRSTSFATEEKA